MDFTYIRRRVDRVKVSNFLMNHVELIILERRYDEPLSRQATDKKS